MRKTFKKKPGKRPGGRVAQKVVRKGLDTGADAMGALDEAQDSALSDEKMAAVVDDEAEGGDEDANAKGVDTFAEDNTAKESGEASKEKEGGDATPAGGDAAKKDKKNNRGSPVYAHVDEQKSLDTLNEQAVSQAQNSDDFVFCMTMSMMLSMSLLIMIRIARFDYSVRSLNSSRCRLEGNHKMSTDREIHESQWLTVIRIGK